MDDFTADFLGCHDLSEVSSSLEHAWQALSVTGTGTWYHLLGREVVQAACDRVPFRLLSALEPAAERSATRNEGSLCASLARAHHAVFDAL